MSGRRGVVTFPCGCEIEIEVLEPVIVHGELDWDVISVTCCEVHQGHDFNPNFVIYDLIYEYNTGVLREILREGVYNCDIDLDEILQGIETSEIDLILDSVEEETDEGEE